MEKEIERTLIAASRTDSAKEMMRAFALKDDEVQIILSVHDLPPLTRDIYVVLPIAKVFLDEIERRAKWESVRVHTMNLETEVEEDPAVKRKVQEALGQVDEAE